MKAGKPIESLIFTIRGQRVILDRDLAVLYGVTTSRLNEQVKRNSDRFPDDFSFKLTREEWEDLRSQFAISSPEDHKSGRETLRSQTVISSSESFENKELKQNRSQSATSPHGGRRHFPRAFTEHGAIMAASVLNSPEAVSMSVFVVRAFVLMREQLTANSEILRRLAEIDKTLLDHDTLLRVIWTKLQPLLVPPPENLKRRIDFSKDQA